MATSFLLDGPDEARITLMLAHGAGAPMDSGTMNAITAALADAGLRVARFEFGYMAARRHGETRPPPKAETVMADYVTAIDDLGPTNGPLLIGGKSMGGRVASMLADRLYAARRIAGLVCLGYPFHPLGRPEKVRTAHLLGLATPALICQGTRDAMGTRAEVETYGLSQAIELLWLEDGDHDLKPRKAISGFTAAGHLETAAAAVAAWAGRVAP